MTQDDSTTSGPLLPWWQQWPGRLEAELERFAALGLPLLLREDPRAGDSRLVVETQLELDLDDGGGERTQIVVVYPDGFPHRRFSVHAPTLVLGRHQAPGGDLCVFPRGDRYWRPHFLAADSVVNDVPRLVALVEAGGEELRAAEDPQGEPFTTYYGGLHTGGIIVDISALSLEASSGDHGSISIALTADEWLVRPEQSPGSPTLVGHGLVTRVVTSTGEDLLEEPSERLRAPFQGAIEGRWIYMPEPPRVQTAQALWDALVAEDASVEGWAEVTPGLQLLALCTTEEVQQDVYQPAWVFLARTLRMHGRRNGTNRKRGSGNPAHRAPTQTASPPQVVRALRWTPDDLAARIPELVPLREATVALVGLGSLGAPLFQELVKSRTRTLRISDFDHIDPGTSVRHPLGLDHAGIDKALALASWAFKHNPEVEVTLLNCMFGAAPTERDGRSEQHVLFDLLNDADLMISAVAEDDVNRQLDLAALQMGVPRLFLWSQSGYGGIVALLQAGKTGCFHCLSLHLSRESQANRNVVQVPQDVDGQPAGTIQALGCGDKTFTANHADLMPISLQAARVAYGLLCGSAGGYPAFANDVFAVQMREPDGRPIAPRWTSFSLLPDPQCPICSPA
jgi:molybdopterin/thiamine biosynthesis adenylyltransferase